MSGHGAGRRVPQPARPPGALVPAEQFEAEIRQAIRSERWLPVKALFALALVGAVLAAHVIFFS
jgi:hypothetical protein